MCNCKATPINPIIRSRTRRYRHAYPRTRDSILNENKKQRISTSHFINYTSYRKMVGIIRVSSQYVLTLFYALFTHSSETSACPSLGWFSETVRRIVRWNVFLGLYNRSWLMRPGQWYPLLWKKSNKSFSKFLKHDHGTKNLVHNMKYIPRSTERYFSK
jgi:hypothetical protein